MRRILPLLLSVFALIAVTEVGGGTILCKSSHRNHDPDLSNKRRGLGGDEYSDLRSDDDDLDDEFPSNGALRDKILRAMLMEDSEDSNQRAEDSQNDDSIIEASLRADMSRLEAVRNEGEWNNRHREYDDDYN